MPQKLLSRMKENKLTVFSVAVLVICFGVLVWFSFTRLHLMVDSDFGGEVSLWKHLSDNNALISSDWYYSTELRVLNAQIVMAPLFNIFDNWLVVCAMGNTLLYVILIFSYIFFMRATGIKTKWILFTAPILLVGFSIPYFAFALMQTYYLVHIILLFFYLGLFFRLIRPEAYKKAYQIVLFILFVFLSLMTGMGGVRYLLIIELPLILMVIGQLWLKRRPPQTGPAQEKKTFKQRLCSSANGRLAGLGLLGVLVAAIGYLVNTKVLSNIYSYASQSNVLFTQKSFLTIVDESIGEILAACGYTPGAEVFSKEGIANVLVFVMIAVIIFCVIKLWKQRRSAGSTTQTMLVLFAVGSFLINFFAYGFVEFWQTTTARFYLPVIILAVPILAVYLNSQQIKGRQCLIGVLLFCYLFSSGYTTISAVSARDINKENHAMINFLDEHNYDFGWAAFEQSDVITLLTNGKVKVAKFYLAEDNSVSPHYWLAAKEVYLPEYQQGKGFLLLTHDQDQRMGVPRGEKVYSDDSYVIYSYDEKVANILFAS